MPPSRSRVVGLVVAASALQGMGCGGDDGDEPRAARPECDTGAVRTQEPIGRATVLACGETQDARKVELWASRDAAGPCVVIVGLQGGPRACGRAPSERVPASKAAIGGAVIVQRTPRGHVELYGETGAEVSRVVLHFQLGKDRPVERTASLMKVDDRRALERADIREPFGYFIGAVPSKAHDVVAEALDRAGESRGRVRFDPVIDSLPPTAFLLTEPGEGQR